MKPIKLAKLKRKEFSKKLVITDTVWFFSISVGCILMYFLVPDISTLALDTLKLAATTYISLRLIYGGKAGIENYNKIKNSLKCDEQEETESSDSEN